LIAALHAPAQCGWAGALASRKADLVRFPAARAAIRVKQDVRLRADAILYFVIIGRFVDGDLRNDQTPQTPTAGPKAHSTATSPLTKLSEL